MNRTVTAVDGVLAGHWTHDSGTTGCTALLFPRGAVAGVFVAGSAPGSRELAVLEARHLTDRIDAICLSGGSAFGLAAADGVMAALAEQGRGFATPAGPVPLVVAAVLYDLPVALARPDAASGRAAVAAASAAPLPAGRVGAGAGATVGKASGASAPGALWTTAAAVAPWTVGVVVAVNAFGSIVDASGAVLAGGAGLEATRAPLGENTTLAAVITDAPLTKGQAEVVARMAAAGLARAIAPAFTPFDGDVVFCASTGSGASGPLDVLRLGAAAADALADATRAGFRRDSGPAGG